MSFNVKMLDLENSDLSLRDLLRVKHSNGTIDYIPMYYLNLFSESLKALVSEYIDDNFLKSSIDFTHEKLEDFYTP